MREGVELVNEKESASDANSIRYISRRRRMNANVSSENTLRLLYVQDLVLKAV